MNVKRLLNHLVTFLALLPALIWSCKDKVVEMPQLNGKNLIESRVNAGDLLLRFDVSGSAYVFEFEEGTVKVPSREIFKITPLPNQWQTRVTFVDNQTVEIPSKGNSLDFVIEKVNLNPSGFNPLAATIDVFLPAMGRMTVIVEGKTPEGTIRHLCNSMTRRQTVPVLGLYQAHKNKITLVYTNALGQERGRIQLNIQTEALNMDGFPSLQTISANTQKMEPGVNLVSYPGESELDVSVPYMVDASAEIRWILLLKTSPDLGKFSGSIGLKRMRNGNFLSGDQQSQRIVEMDMFGNLIKQWDLKSLGYNFHHEITEADNGDFLITVSKNAARLSNGKPRINDHIIQLNPVSGQVVQEWDLVHMLDTARLDMPAGEDNDFFQTRGNWAHNNSIVERRNDFLATARFQGAFSFTAGGKLKWIISPHKDWGKSYREFLLKPIDEQGAEVTDANVINGLSSSPGFDWSWGLHTPVNMPNGNILVFDNGYRRHFKPNGPSGNYSRVVEYKIDEEKRTVQQVWSYGRERGQQGFSIALSGVQYLKQTGNVLFCPGLAVKTSKGLGGRVVEIHPKTNEVVFEMEITAPSVSAFHRVTRMDLYPDNI